MGRKSTGTVKVQPNEQGHEQLTRFGCSGDGRRVSVSRRRVFRPRLWILSSAWRETTASGARSAFVESYSRSISTLPTRTIQRYLESGARPRPAGQPWSTFLENHAKDIWACDLLQTYDIWFRLVFAFFIVNLGTREVIHAMGDTFAVVSMDGATDSKRDAVWRRATLYHPRS